jgi:hypothetical protein
LKAQRYRIDSLYAPTGKKANQTLRAQNKANRKGRAIPGRNRINNQGHSTQSS